MSNTIFHMDTPACYADVCKFLNGKASRKAAHNTIIRRVADGSEAIEVVYHASTVITYTEDLIEVDLCGWDTLTTRLRIGRLAPITIGRSAGETTIGIPRAIDVYQRHTYDSYGTPRTIGGYLSAVDPREADPDTDPQTLAADAFRAHGTAVLSWPPVRYVYTYNAPASASGIDVYGYKWVNQYGEPRPSDPVYGVDGSVVVSARAVASTSEAASTSEDLHVTPFAEWRAARASN